MKSSQYRHNRRAFLKSALTAAAVGSISGRAAGSSPAQGVTYYVDNAGNDGNDGLTPGSAFQTVAKVNSLQLQPGQSVLFKAGGVWRESLVVTRSGSASAGPITYGMYGTGAQPIISGAELATWTQVFQSARQETSPGGGFASGFETANFGDWDGLNIWGGRPSLTITSTHPAHGASCMQFSGDGAINCGYVYKNINPMASGSTYFFRIYVYTPSGSLAPDNDLKYIQFFADSRQLGYAALNTDANGNVASFTLNMYDNAGGFPIAGVSIAPNYRMNEWNYLEVEYTTHTTAGAMQVRVNGQKIGSATSISTAGGIGLDQIQIGNGNWSPIVAEGASIYFDDFQCAPTGPIGPVKLTSTSPAPSQETASAGSFASGFESPGFADWDFMNVQGTPTLSTTTTHPAHGSYCMQLTGDGSVNIALAGKNIPAMTSGSTRYFRVYIYTPSGSLAPNNALKYMQFYVGSKQLGYAALNTDSSGNVGSLTLNMYNGGGGYPIANVSVMGKYLMNQWNYLEVEYKTDPSAGSMQVWVNGQSIGVAGPLNTSGGVGLSQIQVGNGNWGTIIAKGSAIYFDDVVVSPVGPMGAFSGGSAGTVWQTLQQSNPWYPSYNGTPGRQVTSQGALQDPGDWYWDGNNTLYLCSPVNPATLAEIPARTCAMTLSGANYVTISNLNLRGGQVSGLFASGGCNNATITGCILELNWENGGYFLDGQHYQSNGAVSNCVLRNNGASGWNTNGYFSHWLFQGNQAYLNGQILSGSIEHEFSAGIKMFSISGNDGVGTIVQNNLSYANGLSTGSDGQGVGLWADTCKGITFRSNVVHDNNGWGLFLEKNTGSVACFNTCYNNARVPYTANLASKVSDGNNASSNQMFNNTCYGGWWGMYCGAYEGNGQSSIETQIWLNNIATGANYQNLYVDSGGDNDAVNGSGNVYGHNCLGPAIPAFIFWASCGTLSSYSDFDAACGGSSYSIECDPMCTNPASGVFTLQAGSPCIASGVQIPGYTGSNPNIGAY